MSKKKKGAISDEDLFKVVKALEEEDEDDESRLFELDFSATGPRKNWKENVVAKIYHAFARIEWFSKSHFRTARLAKMSVRNWVENAVALC